MKESEPHPRSNSFISRRTAAPKIRALRLSKTSGPQKQIIDPEPSNSLKTNGFGQASNPRSPKETQARPKKSQARPEKPQAIPENEMNLLIGCCGWPEAKPKYFSHFPTAELQSTFYEPPSLALAHKWHCLAPPSFRFCLKAWQLITHQPSSPTYRRLKSKLSPEEDDLVGSFRPTEQVQLAWERTRAIADALQARVILFQCPKSFTPDRQNLANLRAFFASMERGAHYLAWEPRGEEWTDDLIRGLCQECNLVHCVDPFERQSVYGAIGYWRLHGMGGYRYKYTDGDLQYLHQMVRTHQARNGAELYIFFNNIYMKDDAVRFQSLLGGEPRPKPPPP